MPVTKKLFCPECEAELIRRRSYQPLGQYWAREPARLLARFLCRTRVRPNALTLVASNNDASPNTKTSEVTFAPVIGQTYYIAVDGFNAGGGAAGGSVQLSIAVASDNDNFADARPLYTGATSDFRNTLWLRPNHPQSKAMISYIAQKGR